MWKLSKWITALNVECGEDFKSAAFVNSLSSPFPFSGKILSLA